jgi:hypothetical protein
MLGKSSKIGLIEQGANYDKIDKLLVLDTDDE